MFDFLFKPADTPVDKLDTVKAKLTELEISKTELQDKVDQLEIQFTQALVEDSLSNKKAAAICDKLAEDLKKQQLRLDAALAAHKELTDQLPNLQEAAANYEREQREQAVKDQAKADLKALTASIKKAEKVQAEFVSILSEVACISPQAATGIEKAINKALRAEYRPFEGLCHEPDEYRTLTDIEQATLQLKQISEQGSDAIISEAARRLTDAEKAEAKRGAMTAHLAAQRVADQHFNQQIKGAA